MDLTKEQFERNYKLQLTDHQITEVKKGEIVRLLKSVAGTDIKNGIAVAVIDAPPQNVWKVIHDNNNFKDFMPRVSESILFDSSVLRQALDLKFDHSSSDPSVLINFLKKHQIHAMTAATGHCFNLVDMPWPFKNIWYIIELTDIKGNNLLQQTWNMVAGNVKADQGSWTLTPYAGDKTLVVYTALVDIGTSIPDIFINLGNNVLLPDIIRAVRRRVKKI